MKRDQFTVAVRTPDGRPPTLDIVYDGPAEEIEEEFSANGDPLGAEDIDAAFRLRDSDDEDAVGAFSLTRRLTGAYLIEANADADAIRSLVAAARETDGDASYRVRVRPTDDEPTVYQMTTLLVYDSNGELLRQRSLIPSGVEL